MKQLTRMAALLALLVFLGAVSRSGAEDDKDPSIKDIMTKAHKGGNSILAKLGKDLKSDKPDWDEVTKLSKELVSLGAALNKNKPPKGEKESWDKLTTSYQDTTKALLAAAEKKDLKAAAASQKKLSGTCKDCHSAHKGK